MPVIPKSGIPALYQILHKAPVTPINFPRPSTGKPEGGKNSGTRHPGAIKPVNLGASCRKAAGPGYPLQFLGIIRFYPLRSQTPRRLRWFAMRPSAGKRNRVFNAAGTRTVPKPAKIYHKKTAVTMGVRTFPKPEVFKQL
jgi:hypothetical protein